jgi:hypothetical protein
MARVFTYININQQSKDQPNNSYFCACAIVVGLLLMLMLGLGWCCWRL